MKANRFIQILCFIGAFCLIESCATVPITGRTQLNMVSDQQLISLSDNSFSQFMAYANGKSAVLMPSESSTSAKAIAIVNRVSKRIIDAAGLQGKLNWQVVVVKSNNRNAFGNIIDVINHKQRERKRAGLPERTDDADAIKFGCKRFCCCNHVITG